MKKLQYILIALIFATSAYYIYLKWMPLSSSPSSGIIISSKEPHETCFEMLAGHQLYYSYKSSGNVDFDIHFHDGKQLTTPYIRKKRSSGKDIFVANEHREYCLLWKNNADVPVELSYSLNYGLDK